jgi:abortive infection bacteriophage resistance protein
VRTKQFKTLAEQIEILRSKGLVINDEAYAKEVLLKENYLFLTGYRHVFYRSPIDRRYIEGTTFEELYSLFVFDRNLRSIFFKNILIIENNLKSIVSYQLSKKYGYKEKYYMNPKNFNTEKYKMRQVNDVIHKMKRQIRIKSRQHLATMHYLENYGFIPLWVLVKVLSFGIISELYSILKPEDQIAIAEYYDLDPNTLSVYLSMIANYRNLCAHEDILFQNKTQQMIGDTRYHLALNIPITDDEYVYGKNDLFALVIIMKAMLTDNEFSKMIHEISVELELLDVNVSVIPISKILDRMGFIENWIDIAKIK